MAPAINELKSVANGIKIIVTIMKIKNVTNERELNKADSNLLIHANDINIRVI